MDQEQDRPIGADEQPKNGHLGRAWEIAVVVVFIVVIAAVAITIAFQLRRRRRRKRQLTDVEGGQQPEPLREKHEESTTQFMNESPASISRPLPTIVKSSPGSSQTSSHSDQHTHKPTRYYWDLR